MDVDVHVDVLADEDAYSELYVHIDEAIHVDLVALWPCCCCVHVHAAVVGVVPLEEGAPTQHGVVHWGPLGSIQNQPGPSRIIASE